MGQLGLGDGFVEWLRETFVDEEQEDDLLVDQPSSLLMGRQWGTQTVVFPDTQQLVQQMQAPVELACQPLTPDAGDASAQHSRDTAQEPQEHGSRAKGSKKAVRPKNTKRYKSLAQKEAHKRYRERKKQSVSVLHPRNISWPLSSCGCCLPSRAPLSPCEASHDLVLPHMFWSCRGLPLLAK